MLDAFLKAFAQLGDKEFRRPFWWGLGAALLAMAIAVMAGLLASAHMPQSEILWINRLIEFAVGLGALIILTLFFPAISLAFLSLFLDDAAAAVESLHYPRDEPGRALPVWLSAIQSVKFALVVLFLNILILPLYLFLIWFPLASALIYYGLNGYLFGREYFDLVGARHGGLDHARACRKAHRWSVYTAGVVIAFFFTIPILNLLVPLIATAAMTHIYKRLTVIS